LGLWEDHAARLARIDALNLEPLQVFLAMVEELHQPAP
jgi:hypothetical protein